MRTMWFALAALLSAFAIPVMAQMQFPDVNIGSPYSNAIDHLVREGVLQGYDSGWFGPNDPMTRAQVVLLLDRYDSRVIEPLRDRLDELEDDWEDDDSDDDGSTSSAALCPDGHEVGDRYTSPDGCNTCSCTRRGVICTLRACENPQLKCLSSDDCSASEYCSTEDGDCDSACEPGDDMCIQACAGTCKPRVLRSSSSAGNCADIVCSDGTRHPSCTEDGHPINYFADPCMFSNRSSRSSASARSTSSRSRSASSSFATTSSAMTTSCTNELENYQQTLETYGSCSEDDDCTIFTASCPLITCGVAINARGSSVVYSAAQRYQSCKQASGEPLPCAMCIEMRARCDQGKCVAEQVR